LHYALAFTVIHGAGAADHTSPPTTRFVHVRGEELEVFRRVHGSGEWVLEHSIHRLLKAARVVLAPSCMVDQDRGPELDVMAAGTGGAFVFVRARDQTWFFSLDVETMELQEVPNKEAFHDTGEVFAYTLPWPRFLRACPC
jgi:hypothetical protein